MFFSANPMVKQIIEIMSSTMERYNSDNPKNKASSNVLKKAIKTVKSLSANDVKAGMETNNVGLELAALNILQNCAMLYIKPASSPKEMFDDDDALDIYNYINDVKLKKQLITSEQYKENNKMGALLRCGRRPL